MGRGRAGSGEKVWAAGARAGEHLFDAPAGDGLVIAAEEDRGRFDALPDAWACVVGAVEEACAGGEAERAEE